MINTQSEQSLNWFLDLRVTFSSDFNSTPSVASGDNTLYWNLLYRVRFQFVY